MHWVALTAPNGLQGVYELSPYNSLPVELTDALVAPSELLDKLAETYGVERVHWLRLEAHGQGLLYTVKLAPFQEGMVFDAITGERLDPLSDRVISTFANEQMAGTHVVGIEDTLEFHRDYLEEEIPAVRLEMAGKQPCLLFLGRATGRVLRRVDSDAAGFAWWYRNLHVFQWGKPMILFTAVLYAIVLAVVLLIYLGVRLFIWRRRRSTPVKKTPKYKVTKVHRWLAITAGLYLLLQMPVGAYMWLSLGPLETPFRGKTSFNPDWAGGISTRGQLVDPSAVLGQVRGSLPQSGKPVQFIEWRDHLGDEVWIVGTRKDQPGLLFDARTGERLDSLDPERAGRIAQKHVVAMAGFTFTGPVEYYWNDLNRRIPAFQYRFQDPSRTDVFVSAISGEIISRRPAFWRAFLPFFAFHTFGYTGSTWIDTSLSFTFQLAVLVLTLSGLVLVVVRFRKSGRF